MGIGYVLGRKVQLIEQIKVIFWGDFLRRELWTKGPLDKINMRLWTYLIDGPAGWFGQSGIWV